MFAACFHLKMVIYVLIYERVVYKHAGKMFTHEISELCNNLHRKC